MNRLLKIVRSAMPGTGVQFRKTAYGKEEIRRFLRDVIAMANAPIEGPRYIVVGMGFSSKGQKKVYDVDQQDFSGNPAYKKLVTEFVEPMIQVRYQPIISEGKRIGVFEIADCQDRPYMMRSDFSESLRRGDAYVRVENMPVKLGRRQLQSMFEKKFVDSVSAEKVEIGFPGEIIHKDFAVRTVDLSQMPSLIASEKIRQLMDIQKSSKNKGSTTIIARLTHARLFGSDEPYENRSPEELQSEMEEIQHKHANDDQHFLFEKHVKHLQLVVFNQGEEPIEDASLKVIMPKHRCFHVAQQLPMLQRDDKYVARSPAEIADYPSVDITEGAVHVTNMLGDVPTDAPVQAFTLPLRICVGAELKGRKLGIRYSLDGRNLRRPAKGKLRLLF